MSLIGKEATKSRPRGCWAGSGRAPVPGAPFAHQPASRFINPRSTINCTASSR